MQNKTRNDAKSEGTGAATVVVALPQRRYVSVPQPGSPENKSTSKPYHPSSAQSAGSVLRRLALSKREQLMIVTQMSIMLRSGVDVADAVNSVHKRSKIPAIREAMGVIYSSLEEGKSLSAAVESERRRFGGVLAATVSAGEASGRLSEVLMRLSMILRDELRLQNALKSAISYPVILMLVTAMVLGAMTFFVLPQFANIYASSNAPTPVVTRVLLDTAAVMREYWWLLLSGAILATVACVFAMRTPWGIQQFDRMLLFTPFLGNVWRPLVSGRVFRLQGAMLQSGVPMLEVLQLTRETIQNQLFRQLIDQVEEAVVRGEGMATTLVASPCMPDGAAEMIATAEANGQLGEVLQTVGEFFESEGEQRLRDTIKVAEPAIIVVLGLVVGCIVLAIMLPLLDLSTARSHR